MALERADALLLLRRIASLRIVVVPGGPHTDVRVERRRGERLPDGAHATDRTVFAWPVGMLMRGVSAYVDALEVFSLGVVACRSYRQNTTRAAVLRGSKVFVACCWEIRSGGI